MPRIEGVCRGADGNVSRRTSQTKLANVLKTPYRSPLAEQRRALARCRRLTWLLATLLAGSALAHLWIAHQRLPVSAAAGDAIHGAATVTSTTPTRVRLATFNIHRGKGTDRVRDLARTARVLHQVDVAGLNEVAGPSLLGASNQAQQLGERLKARWLYAPNQYRWYREHFGNALLSRLPVTHWYREQLVYDRVRSHSHRNLLTVTMPLWNRRVVLLITHLDRGPIRAEQLDYVLGAMRRHRPAVLLGDLNVTRQDPRLQRLLSDGTYIDAIAAALGANDPPGRVDWIIVRGLRVTGGGFEPVGVSDHPAYWVEVEAPSG